MKGVKSGRIETTASRMEYRKDSPKSQGNILRIQIGGNTPDCMGWGGRQRKCCVGGSVYREIESRGGYGGREDGAGEMN